MEPIAFFISSFLCYSISYLFYCWSRSMKWKGQKIRNEYPKEKINLERIAFVVCSYNEKPEMLMTTLTKIRDMYRKNRIFLLEDSEENAELLKDFCTENNIEIVTRKTRNDFKAGALNNFLAIFRNEFDYIAIVDGDEELMEENFLEDCMLLMNEEETVCVQTRKAHKDSNISKAVEYLDSFFYNHILPARELDGVCNFCGSAGILKIKDIDYFPHIALEDAGLNLILTSKGKRSRYINGTYFLGKAYMSYFQHVTQQLRYLIGFGHLTKMMLKTKIVGMRKVWHLWMQCTSYVAFLFALLLAFIFEPILALGISLLLFFSYAIGTSSLRSAFSLLISTWNYSLFGTLYYLQGLFSEKYNFLLARESRSYIDEQTMLLSTFAGFSLSLVGLLFLKEHLIEALIRIPFFASPLILKRLEK